MHIFDLSLLRVCIFLLPGSPILVIVSGLIELTLLILATISLCRGNKKFRSLHLPGPCGSCHSQGQWLLWSWAWLVWLQEGWELRSWGLGHAPLLLMSPHGGVMCGGKRADGVRWEKCRSPALLCPGLKSFPFSLRTVPCMYPYPLLSRPWKPFLFDCQGLPLGWPLGLKPVLLQGTANQNNPRYGMCAFIWASDRK